MNASQIAGRLARIVNLKGFAVSAGLQRRTLYNVINGTHKPNAATLATIEAKLLELKPKMRPAVAAKPPVDAIAPAAPAAETPGTV